MNRRTRTKQSEGESRRSFFKKTAGLTAAIAGGMHGAFGQGRTGRFSIFLDAQDPLIRQRSVQWAADRLGEAIQSKGSRCLVSEGLPESWPPGTSIVIASSTAPTARRILEGRPGAFPDTAEAFGVFPGKIQDHPLLLVTGTDARGLVYGAMELADRYLYGDEAADAFRDGTGVLGEPVNPVRSIARLFVSEIEDKPWFYDKAFWEDYLSNLIAQRFNRFSLTLGLGYDLPHNVLDSYFIFAYPFLVSVPGYDVKVRWLARGERERNLEMLRWISDQTVARGLDFQLGLWSHTYQWIDSPNANYTIGGLDAETHAPYCRDALRTLIEALPALSGITFRAHSESGIPDGSYGFWKTVFDGIVKSGRDIGIDLHSKNIDFRLIEMAMNTGMPVTVSPKLTAEHMGLPAHQAAIRELERRSRPGDRGRNFTRYGYADYLREDRKYRVVYRIWPGKPKFLMWADPELAAGYGRAAGFCGSDGLELCEPLTFKGRQGSGHSFGRSPYLDQSLRPAGGDWEKYLYTYRMWGRKLYDPDLRPDSWQRFLRKDFGPAAESAEAALAAASRIIPLVTSAHLPSGSAMTYWPELYTNMPTVDETIPHPYGDTPEPKRFGTVSPLDPAMFSSAADFVREYLASELSGRYTPIEVADRLERFADQADQAASRTREELRIPEAPSVRRFLIDCRIHAGTGRFFAGKMRAAVAYEMYLQKREKAYLRQVLELSRRARKAWVDIIDAAAGVYISDLNFGYPPHRRGHWTDRLLSIDEDLAAAEKLCRDQGISQEAVSGEPAGIEDVTGMAARAYRPDLDHNAPSSFVPGTPISIRLTLREENRAELRLRLHYRHVNQAETYEVEEMDPSDKGFMAEIPATYTRSPFSILYFIEIRGQKGDVWLYPGFNESFSNQPYFVVRQASS